MWCRGGEGCLGRVGWEPLSPGDFGSSGGESESEAAVKSLLLPRNLRAGTGLEQWPGRGSVRVESSDAVSDPQGGA